jgi:hypothetical protein
MDAITITGKVGKLDWGSEMYVLELHVLHLPGFHNSIDVCEGNEFCGTIFAS